MNVRRKGARIIFHIPQIKLYRDAWCGDSKSLSRVALVWNIKYIYITCGVVEEKSSTTLWFFSFVEIAFAYMVGVWWAGAFEGRLFLFRKTTFGWTGKSQVWNPIRTILRSCYVRRLFIHTTKAVENNSLLQHFGYFSFVEIAFAYMVGVRWAGAFEGRLFLFRKTTLVQQENANSKGTLIHQILHRSKAATQSSALKTFTRETTIAQSALTSFTSSISSSFHNRFVRC